LGVSEISIKHNSSSFHANQMFYAPEDIPNIDQHDSVQHDCFYLILIGYFDEKRLNFVKIG